MRTAPGSNPVRLRGLKIAFLSPVTKPAHEGAVAVLLKRRDISKAGHGFPNDGTDDDEAKRKMKIKARRRSKKIAEIGERWAAWLGKSFADSDFETWAEFAEHHGNGVGIWPDYSKGELAKFEDDDQVAVVMTSSIDGHAHLLHLHGRAGSSSWSKSEGKENGHDHPFMVTADASGAFSVEIGDSEGHSHNVDSASLTAAFAAAALSKLEENPMPKTTPTTKSAEEVQTLETNLELARVFTSFDDGEREHFAGLDEAAKAGFFTLGTEERQAAIAKAKGPDVQVYKGRDGTVYTKAHDPLLVAAVKTADAALTRAENSDQALDQAKLEKRAEETLPNLPGTAKVKAALLKSVEGIEDEVDRTEALKALAAGESAIAKGYDQLGTSEAAGELGLDDVTPGGQLETAVQKWATDHKVSVAKAYDEFTQTPAGAALYTKSLN